MLPPLDLPHPSHPSTHPPRPSQATHPRSRPPSHLIKPHQLPLMLMVRLDLPPLMRRLPRRLQSVGAPFVSVNGARQALLVEELLFEEAGVVQGLGALSRGETGERGWRMGRGGSAPSDPRNSSRCAPLVSAILNLVRSSCSLSESIPSPAIGREPNLGGTCLIIPRPYPVRPSPSPPPPPPRPPRPPWPA